MIKQDESCENGIQTSISERLQSYMDTLQFFDDSIDAYIYIYDMTRERLYLTDKIREKFPFPPAGRDGNQFRDWINMVSKKDRKFMDHYREMLISGEISSFNITYRIFDREGQKVWEDVTAFYQTVYEKLKHLCSISAGVVACKCGEGLASRTIYQYVENALDQAKREGKAWRERKPDFHISVNMSYVQLQQEGIADTVFNIVKEAGVPGEVLTLEVTESIQLQDYSRYNKIFYAWKQYGIKISIDDFETGYSSLSYLKSIEIDEIKIDRCFVERIQHNAYNYRPLSNMIELAHWRRF